MFSVVLILTLSSSLLFVWGQRGANARSSMINQLDKSLSDFVFADVKLMLSSFPVAPNPWIGYMYRGRYNTRQTQYMAVQCKCGVQYRRNTCFRVLIQQFGVQYQAAHPL